MASEDNQGSTADLVRALSEQTSRLVRDEMELAKVELADKGKKAGIGIGVFGVAGVIALYGLGAIVAFAIAILAKAVATWLAALIVGVVLFVVAGVLALIGKGQVAKATPAAPGQAITSIKTDVDVVKERAQSGRSNA